MATDGVAQLGSRIFLTYRREDSELAVGRLAEDLRRHFDPDQVFQDIASIAPGADFAEALQQGLSSCAAVLVVIGPKWLSATDHKGRRRLDLPDDWVRHEVAESLKRPGVRVFPVLVDDAGMPEAEQLPEPLRPLVRRQAFPLTVRHWTNDIADLIKHLSRVPGLERAATAPAAPSTPTRVGERAAPTPAEAVATQRKAEAAHGVSQAVPPPTPPWKLLGSVAAVAVIALILLFARKEQPEQPPASTPALSPVPVTKPGTSPGARPIAAPGPAVVAPPPEPLVKAMPAPQPASIPALQRAPRTSKPTAEAPASPPMAKVGEPFRDCDQCPEMLVIPAGSFTMGSPPDDKGRQGDEGPQHRVTISRPFALGRKPVTVGEFRRFVTASSYKTEAESNPDLGIKTWDDSKNQWGWSKDKSWRDPGFAQDDLHPVVGVS